MTIVDEINSGLDQQMAVLNSVMSNSSLKCKPNEKALEELRKPKDTKDTWSSPNPLITEGNIFPCVILIAWYYISSL